MNRVEPEACPRCGGPVEEELTCHTWPQTRPDGTEQWMACLPCDSATEWYCVAGDHNEGCGWSWTDGLNPRNPRAAANALNAPLNGVEGTA